MKKTCQYCGDPHKARGMCNKHYARWMRTGDPLALTRVKGKCQVKDCKKQRCKQGYCQPHYYSFQKYGDPLYIEHQKKTRKCSIAGCKDDHKAKGYCSKHLQQFYRGALKDGRNDNRNDGTQSKVKKIQSR